MLETGIPCFPINLSQPLYEIMNPSLEQSSCERRGGGGGEGGNLPKCASQKMKEMGLWHQANKTNEKSFKIGKKFAASKYL